MQDNNSIPNQTFTEETPLVSPYAEDNAVTQAESLLKQVGTGEPEPQIFNPGKSNNFLFGKSVVQIFAIAAVLLGLIIAVAAAGILHNSSNGGKSGDGQALLASADTHKKDAQQQQINNSILEINRSTVVNQNFEADGSVLVQSSQDSDKAFQIQSSAGDNIMVADTAGKKITIGDQPPGNVSLAVNGDITTNGALVSTGGYSLSSQGLTIGGVLVCTSRGCVSSTSPPPTPASPSIDVANLMYLNTNQTITGVKTFASQTTFNAKVTVNAPLQAAGSVNSTSGFSVNGTSGGNFSCAANELLQQAVISGGIITSGSCVVIAGGTTPALQDVYNASTPASVVLSNASGVFNIQDAASPLATNLFQVGSNGNSTLYFAVNNLGISVTGDVNTTGQYKVGGVQISSANLSNDADLAKLNGNQTFSGNNTFSSASNSFTGSGAGLTSLNASNVSSGTLADARLSNNVALLSALQTFTGANTFSNASNSFTGNGSGLTSLNATNVSSGTLADARLSANVTLQGNTFNGASQLVQLTAGGILPVLNGSNLTSLNASNISSGTLADARLSSNVALLNANNIFLGNNSFKLNSTALTVQDAATPLGADLFTVTDSTGATKYFEVSAAGVKINGNDACTTAGNCTGVSGGAIGGSGTAGKIAKFTGSGFTIGDSLLSESGSVVAVGGSINIASGNTYQINGSQITSAALSNDSNLAKLNGTQTFSGANTFSNASNSFTGDGSGLTNVDAAKLNGQAGSYYTNATNISSGTLNDSRLSSNVALKNANNTFTGDNVFSLLNNPLSVQDASTPLGTNLFEVTDNAGTTKYFTVSATALRFNGNDVCTAAGNCTGVTGIGGSGTAGKIAKFTGTGTSVGDSLISDDGTTVTVGGVLAVNTITPTATLTIGTPTQTLTLQGDGSTSLSAKTGSFTNSLVFAAPAVASHSITIPNASGTVAVSASGPLSLDAAGNLTCPSCLTTNGSGGGSGVSSVNSLTGSITLAGTANQVIITPSSNTLTFSLPQDIATTSTPDFAGINIGGSAISSSNLSDSSNLAKLNGTQTFIGANTFSNASNSFTGDGSGLTNLNASNISSGTLNDARLSSNVALLNRAGQIFTGDNTFKVDSASAFQVQNATGGNLLTVDTNSGNIVLNGVNSAQTGAWSIGSNNLPSVMDVPYTVVLNGYIYAIGGTDSTPNVLSSVFYAKLNADGSTGAWQTNANSLPAPRANNSGVAVNGYIYVIGGEDASFNSTNTVFYAKQNANGSLGTWKTNANALPGLRGIAGVTAYNGYAYVIGGWDNTNDQDTVFYAKLNADGSTGAWINQAVNKLPTVNENGSIMAANGYVYLFGGLNNNVFTPSTAVYYAKLNADGSTGAWTAQASNLPVFPALGAGAVVANGYAYLIGGEDAANTPQNKLQFAKLNADGSTGAWTAQASNLLPDARTGAGVALANGYIYVVGGDDAAFARKNTVFYAATSRIQIAGSLDLVGLAGGTLTDGGTQSFGSLGGSITAGNITAVGDLAVQGESSLNGNLSAKGNLNIGGSALFRNSADTTTAFQVQTTSGSSLLNIDSSNSNITLLGAGPGQLSSFITSLNPLLGARSGPSSVAANGYIYVIGGYDTGGTARTTVFYSKLNADGSNGTWNTSPNSLPAGRAFGSAISANGYIYMIGGADNAGNAQASVYYAKLNADGSTGAWMTSSIPLTSARASQASIIANGYVYVIGGYDSGFANQTTVYYAKLNADGSTSAWTTSANPLTAARDNASAVAANGYVYVIGGNDTAARNTVYYAKLNSDGSTGTWTTNVNNLPGNLQSQKSYVSNGYVYTLGGYDGAASQNAVYYAKLNADGSTGSFATNAYNLPAVVDSYGIAGANGYIYVLGGEDTSGTALSAVYYASASRVQIGANLDLVGIQGQNLAEDGGTNSGSSGGSITAGNITAVGDLAVQGQGSFKNSLSTGGDLRVANNGYVGGNLAVGNSSSNYSPAQLLYPALSTTASVDIETTATDLSKNQYSGIVNYSLLDPSAAPASSVYLLDNEVETKAGNIQNYGVVNSIYGQAMHNGSGTVTTLSGTDGYAVNLGIGSVTTAKGGSFQAYDNGSGGSIQNAYGVYVFSSSGNVVNNYGLYLEDQSATGSSASYNLYSAGSASKNFFAGSLEADGNTLVKKTSGTAFQVQSSAAAETLLTVDSSARGVSGGNLVKIGNSTGTDADTTILVVDSATAAPTSNLGVLNGGLFYNSTSNHLSVIENGIVKELCNKTDLGCGSAGTNQTLSVVYANGTSTGDSVLSLDTTRGGVIVKDSSGGIGGTLFGVQSNTGTKYLDVTSAGISTTNVSVAAGGYISITGGNTATRPASPTPGMVYFDTTTNQLLQYNGSKWMSDSRTATKIVAASNSTQAEKDAADYVATGTNDQNTINSAISALPSTGGTVYLLDGTYTLDGSVNLISNMTLAGSGMSTVIKAKNGNTLGLTLVNASSVNNIKIADLKLDGNKSNQTSGSTQPLYFGNVGSGSGTTAILGAAVSNVEIDNAYSQSGIIGGLINSTFDNVRVVNNDLYGLITLGAMRTSVTNSYFQGNGSAGIYEAGGSDGVIVTHSTFVNGGINVGSPDSVIDGNEFTADSGSGVNVASTNTTVSNNRFSATASGGGISVVNGADGSTIIGNNITSSGGDAVVFNSFPNKVTVSNNTITVSGTISGIHIGSATNASLVNNSIYVSGGGYGITNSLSTDAYIANNIIAGAGANAINDTGTGTIYSNQMNSNGDLVIDSQRGFSVGGLSASSSFSLQGAEKITALPTPSQPTITNAGTAGTTTYGYKITALDGLGETAASTEGTTTTGNATLDGTNYNVITWAPVGGAYQYKIYRTTAGGSPNTTGLIGTVAGNVTTFSDTGIAATAAAPTSNTSGGINVQGTALFKPTTDSTAAFQVQNAAGNNVLAVDTAFNSGAGQVLLGKSSASNGTLTFNNSAGSNTVSLVAQAVNPASSLTIQLPITGASAANQCVLSDTGSTTTNSLLKFGTCPTGTTSQTKVVAMGTATGCTGSSPVASLDTNADYVVTSCTSAQTTINSAITALGSTGGTVYLKEGTYIIDGSINLAGNVTLMGSGTGTILKLKDGINAAINLINASSVNNISVKNLVLDGNRTNNTSGTQVGINTLSSGSGTGTSAVNGFDIAGIYVKNFRSSGLTIQNSNNSSIKNINVINNGGHGISFSGSSNITINGNQVYGSGVNGIDASPLSNSSITNNVVQGNTGVGIEMASGTKNTVSGNTVLTNQRGIEVQTTNITITGNTFDSNTQDGILVSATGNTVSGNSANSNSRYGININTSGTSVSGNRTLSNTNDGISITGSSNQVTGNTSTNNGTYGIEITGNTNTISGNAVTSNTSDGIHITGSNSNQNVISGNQINGNSGNGILVDASSQNQITANRIHDNGGSGASDGIQISAGCCTAPDKNSVTNNVITDTAGAGYAIDLKGSAAPTNTFLSNNTFYGTGASAINDTGTGTIYSGQTRTANGDALFRDGTDSSSAFQLQSASGSETLFTADTSARSASGGNLIKIGNSTGTDTATTILVVDSATAAPTSNLGALNGGLFYNSTTGHINVIENGVVKELCNKTDLGCGNSPTTTLQNAYDNSSSPATITTSSSTKGILFKAGSGNDSTSLFQIQNASGTSILQVDSTSRFVGINQPSPNAALDVVASTSYFFDGFETGLLSPFTSTGGMAVSTNNPHSGSYSANDLIDWTGTLSLVQTLSAPGTVSFWMQVGCGAEFDVDGVNQIGSPSQGSYTQFTVAVGSGTHTLTWKALQGPCASSHVWYLDDVKVTNVSAVNAAVFNGGNVGIGTAFPNASLETDGTAIFKAATGQDSANLFQIQNAAGTNILNVNSSNLKVAVNQSNFYVTDLSAPTSPGVAASANTGGTLSGAAATTYYYKVTALNAAGESLSSSEVSINGQGFTKLSAPGAATVGAPAPGGSVDIGTHSYQVTFVTANGETTAGTTSAQVNVTTGGTQTVPLTAIPTGPTGTTARNIYRTVAGDTGSYKFVGTIADNATTTFNDTVADASLGTVVPVANTATTNTNNATVSWAAVAGATSYRIYRGTASGAESAYQTSASSPFTDTGSAGTAATVPTRSTVAQIGIGTSSPSANLDVRGTAQFQDNSGSGGTLGIIGSNLTALGANGFNLKVSTNSSNAFQVQNAGSQQVLNIDSTTNSVKVSQGNLTVTGLANPSVPTLTSSSTGGTLAAGTYYYQIAAINANGTTPAVSSNPTSVTTTGSTSQNTLTWIAVANAASYNVYRSTDGTNWFKNNVSASITSIIDNGTNYNWGTSAGLPATNTTGGNINVNGAATFANLTNSNSAFQVQDSAGDSIFQVDSSNRFIGINKSSPAAALDVAASAPAPAFSFGFEDGTLGQFTNTGGWTAQTTTVHSGAYSAKTTTRGASLQIIKTLSSTGTVSFWMDYYVEFFSGGGFYIDGVQKFNVPGCNCDSGYINYSYPVTAGTHTFTWSNGSSATSWSLAVDDVSIGINSTTSNVALFNGGNVGIGTAAPNATLETDGTAIFKAATNASSTFQLQNASGDSLFNADTTNRQITVGRFVNSTISAPASPGAAAGSNQGGTLLGTAGTTYYYKVTAMTPAGESPLSGEVSINGQSFTKLTAPGAATVGAPSAGGSVNLGTHSYKVTFVTSNGETTGGTTSSQVNVTTGGTQTVPLTAIPTGPTGTTARNIYRTVAGDTGSYLLLTTIANNTTTTYNDTTADASLGAAAPASNTATTNTNNATISWTAVTGATNYRVYRSTASGAETSYQVASSSPFTDTGAAGTALSNSSLSVIGTASIQNTVNSTTAFQVQNSIGSSLLNIDSANNAISLLGNDSGQLGAWTSNATPLPTVLSATTTVVANGYVYEMGGTNNDSGGYFNSVYYAKINGDGSIGSWTTSSNTLPNVRGMATSVYANGFIYVIGGWQGSCCGAQTTVYYTKVNSDGSIGSWKTATPLPDKRYYASSVYSNGYIYEIGGDNGTGSTPQSTVYYAKANPDGTIGPWQTNANALPAAREGEAAVVANGYVYVTGGYSGNTTVYYAKLNSDGSTGAWTTAAGQPLPIGLNFHTMVVSNGYMYAVGGGVSGSNTTVYYTKLNKDGTLGSWTLNSNLFSNNVKYFGGVVTYNGYIYNLGGNSGFFGTSQATIYYASASRIQIGANLDLVGLQGSTAADPGDTSAGSLGGSITAGNITAVGTLQVQGAANLAQSLGIGGNLSVAGNSSLQGDAFVGTRYGNRLFSDNFESGNFNLWNGGTTGTITADTTTVHSGKYAAKINEAANFSAAYNDINPSSTVYMRMWVNATTLSATVNNYFADVEGTTSGVKLYFDTTSHLCAWNLTTAASAGCSTSTVATGGWHQVEIRTTSGNPGTITVWLDSSQVINTTSANNGSGNYISADIGDIDGTSTYNISIDDVSVDTVSNGNASSLSVDDSLHVGGTSTFGNSVYIQATSDSTKALQVQNAAGNDTVLDVDTANLRIGINTSTPATALHVYGPRQSVGSFDYNTFLVDSGATAQGVGGGVGFGGIIDGSGTTKTFGAIQGFKENSTSGNYAGGLKFFTRQNGIGNLSQVLTLSSQGAATFQNSVDSASGFQIQNSTGGSLLNVDSSNNAVSLLGNNSGQLSAWNTNANSLPGADVSGAAVTYNGYIYLTGGSNGTTAQNTTYYAKLNSNGTTGTWTTNANNMPDTRYGHASVAANGYVYVLGGLNTVGTAENTVYYAKVNSDGSLAAWQTNTNNLPAQRYNLAAVVANGYIYAIAGNFGAEQNTIYYAKLNPDGSTGTWTTSSNNLTQAVGNPTAVVANGYLYVMGGHNTSGIGQSTVYYSKLNKDGSIGTWTTNSNALPATREMAGSVVSNGYVYVIAGYDTNGGTAQTSTFYAKLNNDGSVGTWNTNSTLLPTGLGAAAFAIANGYVYVLGGNNGTVQSTVYYASTSRVQVGANLDLVGLQGQTLADGGDVSAGSTGGSITAGNGTFVGVLQVQGAASFAQSLNVAGNLTIGSILFADNTNLKVTLGSASSTPVLLVLGNKNSSGDPTCVTGAIYYNSNSNSFRGCVNGTWTDFINTVVGQGVLVRQTTGISSNTWAQIAWNTEDYDDWNGHTANAAAVTCGTTGRYHVAGSIFFSGGTGSGSGDFRIVRYNSSNVAQETVVQEDAAMNISMSGSATVQCNATDYLVMEYQDGATGAAPTATARMSVDRMK